MRITFTCLLLGLLGCASLCCAQQKSQEVSLSELKVTAEPALQPEPDAKVQTVRQDKAFVAKQAVTEYSLDKKFDWFILMLGMDDSSETNVVRTVWFTLDGKQVKEVRLEGLKPAIEIRIAVKNAMRLEITFPDHWRFTSGNGKTLFINPRVITGTPPPTTGQLLEQAQKENEQLIQFIIDLRKSALQGNNKAVADYIETRLKIMGIILEDTPQGTKWHCADKQ